MCGVLQHGLALSQTSRHQQIFGAGDSDHVSGNACAFEPSESRLETRHHVTVLDIDHRAHGLQTFDVLVHRTAADCASTGQGHFGMPKTRQQWAQGQHRSAHGFDQFIRRFRGVQPRSVQHHVAVVQAMDIHAHVPDQFGHGADILQMRHIGQGDGFCRQQSRAQLWQRGVFGPGDRHFTVQSTATANT